MRKNIGELLNQAREEMEYHLRGVNSSMSMDAIDEDVINGVDYAIECLYDEKPTPKEEDFIRTVLKSEYSWLNVLEKVFGYEVETSEDEDGQVVVQAYNKEQGWVPVLEYCVGCGNLYADCDCYCKECGVHTEQCSCDE